MKIAFVTDDGKTIAQHFGRALGFVIFEIKEKQVLNKEFKENRFTGHARGLEGDHNADHHGPVINALKDCDVVISRGMGNRIFNDLINNGIKPYITDVDDIDEALKLFLSDKLVEVKDFHCKK